MAATLDGRDAGSRAVFEAKFMLPWSFSEEASTEKYIRTERTEPSSVPKSVDPCRAAEIAISVKSSFRMQPYAGLAANPQRRASKTLPTVALVQPPLDPFSCCRFRNRTAGPPPFSVDEFDAG
jgi:hypothetical protein